MSDGLKFTESTEEYDRISGQDIATSYKAEIAKLVELFYSTEISPDLLKYLDNFEDVFVAIAVLKFKLMVQKQKDYGPGNIGKGGMSGLITRIVDKLERAKNLIGDPEKQVSQVKNMLEALPDDASWRELEEFATGVKKVVNPTNAVQNETVEDTFMDIGNYGDIGYAELFGAWGKPLRK